MRTVVCRVRGQDVEREALRQLHYGGFSPASVEVHGALRAAWQSLLWQSTLWPFLIRLRRGDSLVIVRTADEHAPRAAAILKSAGAADVSTHPANRSHLH